MTQPASPFGLQAWVAFLRDKPLPVHTRTSALLRQLLEKENCSLYQLQQVIVTDPVFSMHSISLANQLNRNPETDVTTVELAVSTLGMDRIRQLVETLPLIRLNADSVPHKQYFHTLANSIHAAYQAADLCRFHTPAVINETRTAALIYGVGHWALWRFAPQQMSEIKIRIYEQKTDVALAESDVLGCTIQDISMELARLWQLSRLAVDALRHATSPDAEMLAKLHQHALHDDQLSEAERREIKQLLNATYYPVKLANWLALTVPYGWTKPKALRLVEIISDFLGQPEDTVVQRLHANCLHASQAYHVDGVMAPAAMLLLLPSDLVLSYRLDSPDGQPSDGITNPGAIAKLIRSRTPAAAPIESAPAEARLLDTQLYQQVLNRLDSRPSPYSDAEQLLGDLLRGLRLGLGLHRVCLFRVEERELLPYKQSGYSKGHPMPRFTQSLVVPSLFKKLADKPLAVWVANHNRERIWPELPERFKLIAHQHSFTLISLFVGGQARYFLYGDRGNDSAEVSDFDFKHFKQLAVAANRCLNPTLADPS